MVAATLSKVQVGNRYSKLPPHATIMPWFNLENSKWEEFDAIIREDLIEEYRLGTVVGIERVLYGQNNDILAMRIRGLLLGVHAFMHEHVKRMEGVFDKEYIGLEWSPHISDTSYNIVKVD